MGNIVLLDELTINKIAAGEVIERPASVVKEMIENSIDAGADNITIEIKDGGISYIRISDNGKGIALDDMMMAIERHATSKIRHADDLDSVMTMGFRGEALASISAISNLEIVSKTKDSQNGSKVIVRGGQVLSSDEVGANVGTTMTITELFFNTPVRYKFLKKDSTEAGYVEDVVLRTSIANPKVAFKLINNGKKILQTNGSGDLRDVIYSIYGRDVSQNLIDVEYEFNGVKLSGVAGKPVIARSNRVNQMFYVNSRFIKDKVLIGSTEKAYKGLLTVGKFAFVIIFIEMDPRKVDVNVHPAKLEVRFEDEGDIFKTVYSGVKRALESEELTKYDIEEMPKKEDTFVKEVKQNIFEKFARKEKEELEKSTLIEQMYKNKIEENISDNQEKVEITQETKSEEEIEKAQKLDFLELLNKENSLIGTKIPEIDKSLLGQKDSRDIYTQISDVEEEKATLIEKIYHNKFSGGIVNLDEPKEEWNEKTEPKEEQEDLNSEEFKALYNRLFKNKTDIIEEEKTEYQLEEEKTEEKLEKIDVKPVKTMSLFTQVEQGEIPYYKFLGIAFSTYIIIEMDKQVYMIDQHAAHERIMYEKMKASYYSEEGNDSQLMLLPDLIKLSNKEMWIVKENRDVFDKAGFIIDEFGDNEIKISGVPNVCIDLEIKEIFLETLDEINTVAVTAKQEIEEKFLATIACKASVKAKMSLNVAEVEALMERLLVLPNPFTCPHGRPTAIIMTKNDIDKKFSRT